MTIVFIGFGSIAKKHYRILKEELLDIKVYALRFSKSAIKHDLVINLYNWDDLPYNIDFFIISNPTFKHFETIKKCINYNVPIFVEKPLVSNLEEVEELSKIIKGKDLKLYIAYNQRFNPALKFLKEYLSHNLEKVNEVNVYCGSYLPEWRPGRALQNMYSSKKDEGGGVHLDLIHELDYSCWLFGFPVEHHSFLKKVSSLDIDSYDYAHYYFGYNDFSLTITLNYYRRDYTRTIEIIFENTTWVIDLAKCVIHDNTGNQIFHEEFDVYDTYKQQMKAFLIKIKDMNFDQLEVLNALELTKIALT